MNVYVWNEQLRGKTVAITTFDNPSMVYHGVIHSVVEHGGRPAIIADAGANFYALLQEADYPDQWSVQIKKSEDSRLLVEQVVVGDNLNDFIREKIDPHVRKTETDDDSPLFGRLGS